MKKPVTIFLALFFLLSCNNRDQGASAPAENDLDAARMFIRNALDGKWEEARQFLVQDSVNVQLLETAANKYNALNKQEQRNYREAEPRFYDSRKIGDSITIVNYSNSYMNKKRFPEDRSSEWTVADRSEIFLTSKQARCSIIFYW